MQSYTWKCHGSLDLSSILIKTGLNHDMKPLSLPNDSFTHLYAEFHAKQFMYKEVDTTTEVRNETRCKNLCFRSVFERTARAAPQQSTKHWGRQLGVSRFYYIPEGVWKRTLGFSDIIFIDTNGRELCRKENWVTPHIKSDIWISLMQLW